MHRRHSHWGSKGLRERVEVTRPKAHIFGHVHNRCVPCMRVPCDVDCFQC